MASLPIVHEAVTGCMSLGHWAAGDAETAGDVWQSYREESVLGSTVASAISAAYGDFEEAARLAKGSGRATGRALLGGGVFGDVPVFKELSKCGRSLGDLIGGGDLESAGRRWTEEYHSEVTDPDALPKAFVTISMVGSAVTVTTLSAGLALPAFLGIAATAGASATAGCTLACQGMDARAGKRSDVNVGDVIGSALAGAVNMGPAVILPPSAKHGGDDDSSTLDEGDDQSTASWPSEALEEWTAWSASTTSSPPPLPTSRRVDEWGDDASEALDASGESMSESHSESPRRCVSRRVTFQHAGDE
jgi:hypothetical protein